MGQPPPPPHNQPPSGPQGQHGSAAPFPGQPGQQPPQGPPGQPLGYGQQPPQGPPPGHPQGPPQGYGQQPPQGPPGYGQQPPQGPPQGPPGQYPPGFGPQGPGPGAPKKKTGLIIGGAIGAAVVLIIGGTLVSVNSGRDYLSLPSDCSAVVGEDVLDDVFDGSPPSLEGEYERAPSGFDQFDASLHGVLGCTASNDDADLSVFVILFDRERSDRDMDRYFELALEDANDELNESVPRGEVIDHDFGYGGDQARGYWDEPSIGDRSLAIGVDDGKSGRYLSEFGIALVQQNNAILGLTVDYSGSSRPPDVEELYGTAVAAAGSITKQIPRAAER